MSHLHSCSVGDGLIGVDGLAQLLAVEEVLQHLLHLGDTCRSANQHNLIHLSEREALSVMHDSPPLLITGSTCIPVLAGFPQQQKLLEQEKLVHDSKFEDLFVMASLQALLRMFIATTVEACEKKAAPGIQQSSRGNSPRTCPSLHHGGTSRRAPCTCGTSPC